MADCPRCLLNLGWCSCGEDPEVLRGQVAEMRAQLHALEAGPVPRGSRLYRAELALEKLRASRASFTVRLAEAEGLLRDALRPMTGSAQWNAWQKSVEDFLTPSGEAAKRLSEAAVDPPEGKAGDAPSTTGGEVSASPDRVCSICGQLRGHPNHPDGNPEIRQHFFETTCAVCHYIRCVCP